MGKTAWVQGYPSGLGTAGGRGLLGRAREQNCLLTWKIDVMLSFPCRCAGWLPDALCPCLAGQAQTAHARTEPNMTHHN